MAQIRTFICFELPESIHQELSALQKPLKAIGTGVRWSKPEGMHLTLKFLGDVDESLLHDIYTAVKTAADGVRPFPIELAGAGAFPNFNRPNVYWIGITETSGTLARLQHKIEDELEKLGFAREQRKFSPHLTIGRVKSQQGLKEISTALQEAILPSMTFLAKDIIVMQSRLQPGGARYTPLSVVKLSE